ncbi:Uncharacterised protein [Mycobacteroides abscessus subsp. abscessus]|nr:Uncharacterised protein [Mycobacteroides abscessus subsp. abscessus]
MSQDSSKPCSRCNAGRSRPTSTIETPTRTSRSSNYDCGWSIRRPPGRPLRVRAGRECRRSVSAAPTLMSSSNRHRRYVEQLQPTTILYKPLRHLSSRVRAPRGSRPRPLRSPNGWIPTARAFRSPISPTRSITTGQHYRSSGRSPPAIVPGPSQAWSLSRQGRAQKASDCPQTLHQDRAPSSFTPVRDRSGSRWPLLCSPTNRRSPRQSTNSTMISSRMWDSPCAMSSASRRICTATPRCSQSCWASNWR